ncbi:DeoR/GlpR family DNA-binding transcription regulator [Paenibacillus radicis (ex Gao et al. 2016)]|uniref:HTH-type transcriptional regulator YulB n=1 Tax=Paenibacillus radicis (ex Gao et al. 2016) TaxID=1737354 RepID=A0A917GY47_9BACL|nr:DeoR/GlpR family DNA-binding transcription regulator [Paenibacillus radicis (ex Gao et al. 2016)]GGG60821.1 putative HTH-type transcriptional regulator YulB [Paenibacillus radicis (ex Gao et al. 2016)]
MSISERKLKILHLLQQTGNVRVTELSTLLGVTDETIRKDLDSLSESGKLQRTHGGALPLPEVPMLSPHLEREQTHAELKKEIADIALRQIQPHDTIAMDGSTTVSYLAKIMPDIPLTVVTNSMKTAFELSSREHIHIISVGGVFLRQSYSFHGSLTERILKEYHVHKAFLSCTGLHSDRGFSDSNEAHASVKKRMIEIADDVYYLLDSSKLGVKDLIQIAPIQSHVNVITDTSADPAVMEQLADSGVRWIKE